MSILKWFKGSSKKQDKNKKTVAEQQREFMQSVKNEQSAKADEISKAQEKLKAEEKSLKDDKSVMGREATILFRRSMYSSKLIGTTEDLIPFAWRQPLKLSDKKKMSKVFKTMATEQVEREMRMPVKQD